MDCVKCGLQPGFEKAGYLCLECLKEQKAPPSPPALAPVICIECGRVKRGKEWIGDLRSAVRRMGETAARRAGAKLSHVEVELNPKSPTNGIALIIVEVEVPREASDSPSQGFEYEWKVPLKIAQGLCDDCGRRRGGYWEAILQLRSESIDSEDHPLVSDILSRVSAGKDRNAFVAKIDEVRGGYDVYLGSWRLAERIAREIAARTGAETKSSKKIHTRRDGHDVFRSSFLVRYPDVTIGDVFIEGRRAYKLLSLTKKGVRARDLVSGEPVPLEKNVAKLKVVARSGEAKKAVIISQSERDIELLDPETFEAVTIQRPVTKSGGDVPAAKVAHGRRRQTFEPGEARVIRVEGRLYLYE